MLHAHETRLHRVRWLVATLRVRVALLRTRLILRGYNPNQPRVPAGNPEGGRWTDGDGGGSGTERDRVRLAENEIDRPRPIDLREEENTGGGTGIGHTLRYHVGKTDEYLLTTLRAARYRTLFVTVARIGEGSFATEADANNFVNRTIEANTDAIKEGLRNDDDFAVQHRFGYVTGREAFRPDVDTDPYMQQTYEVRVVLRPDSRRERGYSVVTAFPLNRDSGKRQKMAMNIPDSYIEYAASFYPRLDEEVSSEKEFIARGLRFLSKEQFAELKAFLPRALAGGCTVAELQRAWMSAGPRFGFNDRDLPIFLRMTMQVMDSEGWRPKRLPGR